MSFGWKRVFAGGVVALGLAGAACSNYGGVTTTSSAPAPATSAAATTGAATSAPASSAPATTGATSGGAAVSCDKSSGGTAAVTQSGFAFQPAKFTAKSCTTVKVTNKDTTAHTFTIPGTAINLTLPGPGSQSVQLNIPPGTYVFYCRFHGSPDGSGMAGKVTVT